MGAHHRIAIIGIGAVGQMHARAINQIPGATLVAGSCRTEEKGRQFADEFGCVWYSDYEEMLAQEKPSVVTICTPSGAHLEPTLACAKRGIHILCEKPMEISCERVDQMIHKAKKAKVLLGGIFPQRFNPVMRTLHKAMSQQRFGHIATANAYVPWWRDDDYYSPDRWQGTAEMDGGGALINQSIHMVDALQWIAGAGMPYLSRGVNPVEQVFAYTSCRGHDPGLLEVEDTAVIALRFRNGALGQILGATSMYPGTYRRLQIGGRDGLAEVVEDQLTIWQFREPRPEDESLRQEYSGQAAAHGGGGDPMAFDCANHQRNIADFLGSVERGEQPALDGIESRKAVAIAEAIYESARTGKAVSVRERGLKLIRR
jgi:UDP-N-acetyl-2-amino-2-deoxyglucuronate dehydrogenase